MLVVLTKAMNNKILIKVSDIKIEPNLENGLRLFFQNGRARAPGSYSNWTLSYATETSSHFNAAIAKPTLLAYLYQANVRPKMSPQASRICLKLIF